MSERSRRVRTACIIRILVKEGYKVEPHNSSIRLSDLRGIFDPAQRGRVIGIALTSFGGDSDLETAIGKVTVFVNAHHWENAKEMHQLRAEVELLQGELASRDPRAEIESLRGELAARDEQVRELRTEFNELRLALGINRAALVEP